MKKRFLFGLLALSAICLVGCKDTLNIKEQDLVKAIQQDREKLTQAETYLFEDFYETDSTNVVSLLLASNNVKINYDGIYFSDFTGTGYAFNFVLYTDSSAYGYPAEGVYTPAPADEVMPFTCDLENSYLSVLNGDNATKIFFDSVAIQISALDGGLYTIAVNVISVAGAKITASYSGILDGKYPAYFREPTNTTDLQFEAVGAIYTVGETNYADWAQDSAFSYNAEECAFYAEMYAYKAEEAYQAKDTATGDKYMSYAEYYAGAAEENAASKEYYTPANAHIFTLATENGDVLNLEIDLWRLDPEYTEVIPDGKYLAAEGFCYIEKVEDLWTSEWDVYGSYLQTADGQIYYISEAEVSVMMNKDQVVMISVKGTTINGSSIQFNYGVDK